MFGILRIKVFHQNSFSRRFKIHRSSAVDEFVNYDFEKMKIQTCESNVISKKVEDPLQTRNWGMRTPIFRESSKEKRFLIAGFEHVELKEEMAVRSPYDKLSEIENLARRVGSVLNKGLYPNFVPTTCCPILLESIDIRDLFINYDKVDWLRWSTNLFQINLIPI